MKTCKYLFSFLAVTFTFAACGTDNGDNTGGNLNLAEFEQYNNCNEVGGDVSDIISHGYQSKMYDEEKSRFFYSHEWYCNWVYEKQDEFGKEHGCSGTCTSTNTEYVEISYFSGSRINYPITDEYEGDSRVHPVTREDVVAYLANDELHGPRSYEIISSSQITQSGYDNIIIVREFNTETEDRMDERLEELQDYRVYHMIMLGPHPTSIVDPSPRDDIFLGDSRVTIDQRLEWYVKGGLSYDLEQAASFFRLDPSPPFDEETIVGTFLNMLEPQ